MEDIKQNTIVRDEKFLEKAYLLANGMVKIHEYTKERAIREAIKLTRNWFKNQNNSTLKLN